MFIIVDPNCFCPKETFSWLILFCLIFTAQLFSPFLLPMAGSFKIWGPDDWKGPVDSSSPPWPVFTLFCCRWLLISGRQGCYDWASLWLKDWLEPLKTLTHPLLARRRHARPFFLIKPLSSKNPATYFTFLWRRKIKSPAVWRRPLVFTLSWQS